jgi:hypothetical protein
LELFAPTERYHKSSINPMKFPFPMVSQWFSHGFPMVFLSRWMQASNGMALANPLLGGRQAVATNFLVVGCWLSVAGCRVFWLLVLALVVVVVVVVVDC